MKSKALLETEYNIERMGLGLADEEFDIWLARRKRRGLIADLFVAGAAVFVIAVCLYDPLAETLSLALQFAVKALENLA